MAALNKSFLSSDTGGVLAGPLTQLAFGGKPSIKGLGDPAHLVHAQSTPIFPAIPTSTVSIAPTPTTPITIDPNLQPFADANNAANAKQRSSNASAAAGIPTIFSSGSSGSNILGG